MISKPLFKQSCKANAVSWTFVTAITCFMLAILIVVLGGIDVNAIRSSMVNMFVTDAVEANVQKQSITYFDMTSDALNNYEQLNFGLGLYQNAISELGKTENELTTEEKTAILDALTSSKSAEDKAFFVQFINGSKEARDLLTLYNLQRSSGVAKEIAISNIVNNLPEEKQTTVQTFLEAYDSDNTDSTVYDAKKISQFVSLDFVNKVIYQEVLETQGEEVANIASGFIQMAIGDFIKLPGGITPAEFSLDYIPTLLGEVFISQEINNDGELIKIRDYYTQEQLVNISNSSIISYTAQMTFMQNEIKEQVHQEVLNGSLVLGDKVEEEIVEERMLAYKNQYIKDHTGTLLEEFPADVAEALQELGSMDIYALVIGSIFFRIAGLLLPIIYIIMTANNLIATQVDTGSMAYVLSTPTKRKTVSLTQMLYLIVSLLGMFTCTTVTGVIALAIAGSSMTITITDMLLFNLGAFITTFAISGICFLASSWFNRSKQSMAVGGGLSMFFLVATILGLFGSSVMPQAIKIDAMNAFNYISLISLFDTVSIMSGTLTFLWKLAILVGIGAITYFIAVKKFEKKDLPL